jgi:hypothetical protein
MSDGSDGIAPLILLLPPTPRPLRAAIAPDESDDFFGPEKIQQQSSNLSDDPSVSPVSPSLRHDVDKQSSSGQCGHYGHYFSARKNAGG